MPPTLNPPPNSSRHDFSMPGFWTGVSSMMYWNGPWVPPVRTPSHPTPPRRASPRREARAMRTRWGGTRDGGDPPPPLRRDVVRPRRDPVGRRVFPAQSCAHFWTAPGTLARFFRSRRPLASDDRVSASGSPDRAKDGIGFFISLIIHHHRRRRRRRRRDMDSIF